MVDVSTPTRRGSGTRTRTWAVVLAACTGQFLVVLDVSVVNVALPSMRADLGLSTAGLQWVLNAYSIAFAGFMLLGGRAADLYGRKRMFLVGLGLFTAASLMRRTRTGGLAVARRPGRPGARRGRAGARDPHPAHRRRPRRTRQDQGHRHLDGRRRGRRRGRMG